MHNTLAGICCEKHDQSSIVRSVDSPRWKQRYRQAKLSRRSREDQCKVARGWCGGCRVEWKVTNDTIINSINK